MTEPGFDFDCEIDSGAPFVWTLLMLLVLSLCSCLRGSGLCLFTPTLRCFELVSLRLLFAFDCAVMIVVGDGDDEEVFMLVDAVGRTSESQIASACVDEDEGIMAPSFDAPFCKAFYFI